MADGTSIRGDLNTVVEEALQTERMLIGTRVAPFYGVDTKTGEYPKFNIPEGKLLRDLSTERAPTAEYGKVVRQYVNESYTCVDRGLEELVDDTYAADVARFYDAEAAAARMTLKNILIAHERRVATKLFDDTVFAATNSAVAYTEGTLATINFALDVQNRIEELNRNGEQPNTLVMSAQIANLVKRSTLFQNFVKPYGVGATGAIPTDSVIAEAFRDLGITQILIGRAGYDTNPARNAKTVSGIWSNAFVFVGNIAEGNPFNGGALRTFAWNAEGGLVVTETYRDENRRSNVVRVRQHTDEKVINPNSGRLITTQFA